MPDTTIHANTTAADPATTKHYVIDFVHCDDTQQIFSTQADLTEDEAAYLQTVLDRHEAEGAILDPQIYVSFEIHQDFAQVKAELGDALGDPTLGTEADEAEAYTPTNYFNAEGIVEASL
jgi:hypothetical protein